MAIYRCNDLPRYLTGSGAIILALYFLISYRGEIAIVIASIYFVLACAIDTHMAKIPNLLNFTLALVGVIFHCVVGGGSGFLTSLTGLVLGLALLTLPYMMGGIGAGDVKAVSALGALVGPIPLLHIFVYMAFFGGAMAVVHYLCKANLSQKAKEWWMRLKTSVLSRDPGHLRSSNSEPLRFPYAAAIAFGYYSYLAWGEVL